MKIWSQIDRLLLCCSEQGRPSLRREAIETPLDKENTKPLGEYGQPTEQPGAGGQNRSCSNQVGAEARTEENGPPLERCFYDCTFIEPYQAYDKLYAIARVV